MAFALKFLGNTEMPSRAKGWRVFAVSGAKGEFVFLGPSGACRYGKSKSASYNADRFKTTLLNLADKEHKPLAT
jgi:hypothetical protein